MPKVTELEPFAKSPNSPADSAEMSRSESMTSLNDDILEYDLDYDRNMDCTAWYHGLKVFVRNFYTREQVVMRNREDLLTLKSVGH